MRWLALLALLALLAGCPRSPSRVAVNVEDNIAIISVDTEDQDAHVVVKPPFVAPVPVVLVPMPVPYEKKPVLAEKPE